MRGFIIVRPADDVYVPFVDHELGRGQQVKVAYNRLGGTTLMVYTSEDEAEEIASFYPTASVVEVTIERTED